MINVLESIIHTSLSSHLPNKTTRVEREREGKINIGRLNTESTVIDKHFRSFFKESVMYSKKIDIYISVLYYVALLCECFENEDKCWSR